MIGKILGNRYEILEKIGTGGMGDVYKAHCHKLDRIVAIKVLKAQYNDDNNFIRKFKRESLAAASISHPNIVSIYDVGTEEVDSEKVHYIVMEFIDGKTLKELIADEGKIPEKRALNYLAQITEALKVAHNKGIVHRDIKSQNIMVTKDYRVKVTDFGIARVADNATVTATNAIMGSVHYFSPEQARGSKVDHRSDIYSLGIVMFEMLTGRVPFDADNPVSVALMQVQGNMPIPSTVVPDISKETDSIVLKMTQKDPDDRYADVSELMKDIKNIQLGKTNPNMYSTTTRTGRTSNLYANRNTEPSKKVVRRRATENYPREKKSESREYKKKEKSSLPVMLGVLCALLLVFLIIYIGPNAFKSSQEGKIVTVPGLVGKSDKQAREELEALGLVIDIEAVEDQGEDSKIEDRQVLSQDPIAGEKIKEGSTVVVKVNVKPQTVVAPNLVGKTLEQAKLLLDQSGLLVGDIKNLPSADYEEGQIFQQEPENGENVPAGSKIKLYISSGKDKKVIKIPNISGLSVDDAEITLKSLGFEVKIKEVNSSNVDFGEVSDYNPKGEAEQGSVIELLISKGPEESSNDNDNSDKKSREEHSSAPSDINVDVPDDGETHSLTITRYTKNGKQYVLADFKNLKEDFVQNIDYAKKGDRFEVILDGKVIKDIVLE
ncbi:serine/threonine protein kinase [Peptoniphilus asaccharolyticus DSM 20463]|uniref:non-specific serine/threonine protein kinase n=1 Tax=Peptoniphilus asaccharolyticus DSM 20463 TaxID=573058 RepID=A0A1W1UWS2_PEPAS|nr:Stk1 family PASTA domain-containing Ser/Thr kinase [Peptoniphilus asaccharolyticus]MBL7575272.1 Stk1 family PASTA domain-containing Ser/Thr kinase [Peptoniphilus asaccharolyticus]SMB85241.1 serine/threonine protein kinase [Peptoniphilus asaccharolyticus DSM 20463]